MNKRIFVSFQASFPNGATGFGDVVLETNKPIDSRECIEEMRRVILDKAISEGKLSPDARLAILNWRRLEESEEQA